MGFSKAQLAEIAAVVAAVVHGAPATATVATAPKSSKSKSKAPRKGGNPDAKYVERPSPQRPGYVERFFDSVPTAEVCAAMKAANFQFTRSGDRGARWYGPSGN